MHHRAFLLGAVFVATTLSGCSEGSARCVSDADCGADAYCLEEAKVCVEGIRIEGAFALVLGDSELELEQGGTAQLEVRVVRAEGVEGEVELHIPAPPPGVQAGTVSIPPNESSRLLDLSADLTAALQRYELQVEARLGDETKVAPLTLTLVPPSTLRVMLTKPTEVAYTNGLVEVEVLVAGGAPDVVELVRNGSPLAQLSPPYRFVWDTTGEPEGQTELTARAFHQGEWRESARRVVVVDRTPPVVSVRVPESGATDVRVDATVRVQFSEPVQSATLTGETLQLVWNGAPIPSLLTVEPGGQAFTLRPEGPLQRLTSPSVRLTAGIRDRAGNALAPVLWTFHVPAFVPAGPPVSGGAGTSFIQHPSIQVDAAGRVYVAFVELGAGYRLVVHRWDGAHWVQVADDLHAIQEADTPVVLVDLALDDGGAPVVAWVESSKSGYVSTAFAARLQPDGTWKQLGGGIQTPQSGGITDLKLVIDAAGNPIVATASFWDLVKVWRWSGTSWMDLASSGLVRSDPESPWEPDQVQLIRTDVPGELVLSYRTHLGKLVEPERRVLVHRWDGNGWSAVGQSIDLFASRVDVGDHDLVLMDGAPSVVAQASASSFVDLETVRWSGSAWNRLDSLRLDLGSPATTRLGSSSFLAGLEKLSESERLVRIFSWSGSQWLSVSPGLAVPGASGVPGAPVIASNAAGELVVAWSEPTANGQQLHVRRLNR